MLLIHTVILFLAFSSTFEGKKRKNINRPKGMGTNKTPGYCIERGIQSGIEPNRNGDGAEWLAAVCPGVIMSGGKKKEEEIQA